MPTRRRVVLGGATAVTALTLGGCLGSDESPDENGESPEDENGDAEEETDRDEAHSFSVDRLEYTTERAVEYGEYSLQPNGVYRDGDIVWLYLEVSNVTPVSDGPHLESTWEVVGPDGAVLTSFDESIEIAGRTFGEPPNEVYVTQGIDTSQLEVPESGEFTTTVTLTDTGSDETDEISGAFTLERFEFDSVVFTANEPEGVREYEEQPDATYAPGDTVWLYVSVKNVPVDSAGTATLHYTFDVETPEGDTWESVPEREESWDRVRDAEILIIWEGFTTYEDDPTGEYELTITVDDQADGQQITTTKTFVLE